MVPPCLRRLVCGRARCAPGLQAVTIRHLGHRNPKVLDKVAQARGHRHRAGCTVAFDVPLDNVLAGVDAAIAQAASAWADDLQRWTRRNHVGTIAATTSCALDVGVVAAS